MEGHSNHSLGDRVVSARAERMTARDAARRQPTSAKRAVLFEGFDRIRGAAWIITAGGGEQRTERYLVAADQQDKNGTHWTRLPVSDVGRRLNNTVRARV